MPTDELVRELRGVRDRQVVGGALVDAIIALANQAPPPLAERIEALAIEAMQLCGTNLSEVTALISRLSH